MRRRSLASALLLCLLPIFGAAGVAQAAPPIDQPPNDWVVGQRVKGYACWTKAARYAKIVLQAKAEDRTWVTLTVGRPTLTDGRGLCSRKYPVRVDYSFRLDVTPWKPIAESRGFLVSFREFAPPTGPGYSFAQKVYRTADDMQRDIDEANCVALGGENCYAEP
jgi:hypothetical protein